MGDDLDAKGRKKKKGRDEKFDENELHEFSFNSIIPISLGTECGALIFSVASYLFTKERDLEPYYGDSYVLHLEEIFMGLLGVAMVLNIHWLWHYRSNGRPYTKVAKIMRSVEGVAVITGAVLLVVNAVKVNADCDPPPEAADPQCHKLEAKMAAVGMCILDALLHLMKPVDSLANTRILVVTQDFSMIKMENAPHQNGHPTPTPSSSVVIVREQQTHKPSHPVADVTGVNHS